MQGNGRVCQPSDISMVEARTFWAVQRQVAASGLKLEVRELKLKKGEVEPFGLASYIGKKVVVAPNKPVLVVVVLPFSL